MTSCVERYDVIYHPFPINCQYLKMGGGEITISQINVIPQYSAILTPERGVLPYMAYTGMCRWKGYGFRPLCPKQGI